MIADIFGESGDEEEEEFTVSVRFSRLSESLCSSSSSNFCLLHLQGFNQEDLEGDKKESKEQKQREVEEESDSDDGIDRSGQE